MIRFALSILLLAPTILGAQTVNLTPTQQQMLNSLPPAQREEALQAIRELRSSSSGRDATGTSINETDDPDDYEPDERSEELQFPLPEARADSRSRLVINFSPRLDLEPEDVTKLEEDPVLRRLEGSHLFVLDEAAILSVPGLDQIPLLGLIEEDIEHRLAAERSLALFDIEVRILEQEPIGVEALEPFGYDVFRTRETSFDAPSTGPVPPDYALGPGDSIRVQFFGNINGIYEDEISRDGVLNVPEIGPVTVAGLSFSELRADLDKRVSKMLIGTQVSVTMGMLRTMRVFVLGDVDQPGSHLVSGLATISSALYKSGGVSDIGTLRNIQLKRNGKLVTRLDFYDLLINGDTSSDQRLQAGDVIFVPPVGHTIAVSGAVKRPAIYEVRAGATLGDAVELAGGLTADAFPEGARLERVNGSEGRTTQSVDLTSSAAASLAVSSGDTLLVPLVLPDVDNSIVLTGHVYRPGVYAWRPAMRLTDLIRSPGELKAGVDINYVLIRRQEQHGKPVRVISADLERALEDRGGVDDPELQPRDQVFVFNLELGRERTIGPIIDELKRQATHAVPASQVEVGGNVRVPGIYPLEAEMRISDLIRAGGSLAEEAYTLRAELTRYSVVDGETRVVSTKEIDIPGVLSGDTSSDLLLKPYDYLNISKLPEWDSIWSVTLEGEIRFPGTYRIKRGETLAEVLVRAGGLTDEAFPEGTVFIRESLREREQEQIEILARRLESDLTSLSLQAADSAKSDTLATGRTLLDQLRQTKAVGRLVIDPIHLGNLSRNKRSGISIELKDGDQLLVPPRSQVVTVIGETQQNTSHLYLPELSRDDYISLSGGLTRRADKSRIYIVRANGAVVVQNRSRWFGRGGGIDVRPGDTIVVPLDADKIRPLTFWTNVTQILYQGAIAVAAIKTFDN